VGFVEVEHWSRVGEKREEWRLRESCGRERMGGRERDFGRNKWGRKSVDGVW
jgi:hypothetical protein